jgi:hypothetical protein
VEDGPLQYILTRSPSAVSDQYYRGAETGLSGAKNIEAIYHHVGVGLSLSQAYSEGVLLLPLGTDPRAEAVYVASVLGMLWRLRGMDVAGNEGVGRKGWRRTVKGLLHNRRAI